MGQTKHSVVLVENCTLHMFVFDAIASVLNLQNYLIQVN